MSATRFTDTQGQYLAFIDAYTRVHGRPPAETDMQRHFRVSPPSVHQMVLTLVVSGAAFPIVVGSLWRSFGTVQLGTYVPTEAAALHVAALAGTAMATGLAVGAPIAAAVMAIDTALGMASRFAPQMNLQEVGAPLRIIGGGAVVWLGIGILCDRLLAGVFASNGAMHALIEVSR